MFNGKDKVMKILYVTTIGGTMAFFEAFIKQLLGECHTVNIATNEDNSSVPACYKEWGCTVYQINTSRSPLSKGNLQAIKQIKEIVTKEKYDIVHCHTPIAAMCTRIACRKARKNGTKVFYTAHGFHFYKGAPLKNWGLFFPVETLCAHWTDVLFTMNTEDYALAKKKMKAKRVEYVPGVGIDLSKFGCATIDKVDKRKGLGIPEDAVLLLSVGELNKNKNHETVIRAIPDMNVYYIIAGKGGLHEHLQGVIDALGMTERVKLLGYRTDVAELYAVADLFVFPSFREGLPVSVMEAMASGLPVACSKIRGNVDLIDENGGVLFDPHSVEECQEMLELVLSRNLHEAGTYNRNKVKDFDIRHVNERLMRLYEE